MRKIKNKRVNPQLIEEQESYSIKNTIIIILIIIAVFGLFYYLTTIVVRNQSTDIDDTTDVSEEYQSEKILFGQMLTRKESEYYVYAYDESSKFYDLYDKYLQDYNKKENALEMYKIDLNDGMNKSYVGSKNVIGEDLENLQVSGITLFKIKDGKIVESYTDSSDISDQLKKLVND